MTEQEHFEHMRETQRFADGPALVDLAPPEPEQDHAQHIEEHLKDLKALQERERRLIKHIFAHDKYLRPEATFTDVETGHPVRVIMLDR